MKNSSDAFKSGVKIEEHDSEYDYDSLQEEKFVHTRCYDWDPKTGFEDDMSLYREYYHVQEDEEDLFPLPNSVEELYEYLDEQLKEEYDYATEEEAAMAYNRAASELHGSYAFLNNLIVPAN